MAPSEIRLTRDRKQLEIMWHDGICSRLDASHLRENSRSACTIRAAIDGDSVKPSDDLRIIGVQPVGSYAINLVFSDGHDRGSYPWSYLRRISGEAAVLDERSHAP